ncbi:MAG: hypothetical protein IJ934_01475 [Acetobacter sp.]|nr:hypothetical protein [Acetobacter sp.]
MTDLIEGFSEQKICSRNFVIFLSVAYGFSFFGWEIVYFALLVYWSFLAKREIERYASQQMCISYEMNSFYTVVFNMYYINYCLNDLQEASEMCSLRNQNIREDGRSSQHCHKERVMEDANFFE